MGTKTKLVIDQPTGITMKKTRVPLTDESITFYTKYICVALVVGTHGNHTQE